MRPGARLATRVRAVSCRCSPRVPSLFTPSALLVEGRHWKAHGGSVAPSPCHRESVPGGRFLEHTSETRCALVSLDSGECAERFCPSCLVSSVGDPSSGWTRGVRALCMRARLSHTSTPEGVMASECSSLLHLWNGVRCITMAGALSALPSRCRLSCAKRLLR